jgi:hypothetical protein
MIYSWTQFGFVHWIAPCIALFLIIVGIYHGELADLARLFAVLRERLDSLPLGVPVHVGQLPDRRIQRHCCAGPDAQRLCGEL